VYLQHYEAIELAPRPWRFDGQ